MGCQSSADWYSEHTLLSPWTYVDSLGFELSVADTQSYHNMNIILRHDKAYAYQNLYMKWCIRYPSGVRQEELLNIDLADKAGHWYGDCRSKECCLIQTIQAGFRFDEIGDHHIVLYQHSRDSALWGIHSVGLELWTQSRPTQATDNG